MYDATERTKYRGIILLTMGMAGVASVLDPDDSNEGSDAFAYLKQIHEKLVESASARLLWRDTIA